MAVLKKYQLGILGANSKSLVYQSFNLDNELAKVNPVNALTSGKFTANDIGKTVYLSNSAIKCQEWQIADVNHDGTTGTVDLFPKYVLEDDTKTNGSSFDSFQFAYSGDYSGSLVRQWLNNNIYSGFADEIKNAMKIQGVVYYDYNRNYNTLYDKVKLPSLEELGCRAGTFGGINGYTDIKFAECTGKEGYIYPLFGSQQLSPNNSAVRYLLSNNKRSEYFTRTILLGFGDEYVVYIGKGAAYWYRYYQCTYLVAIIRF